MFRLRRLGLERQKSGVRSQNEEHLIPTFCSLLRTFCFALTACVFFSDPAAAGPAIIFPRWPVTISQVMESIKMGSTLRINAGRGDRGTLWQPRFFDRALRSVREYYEKVE